MRRALLGTAALVAVTCAAAQAHGPPGGVGGEPVAKAGSRAEVIAARRHFFGVRNVDPRTGRVREDRVILSWFGVSNFAMAIGGKVVLLDAWVPRGAHTGYVPTSPGELAALRPRAIFIGHAHFDHAADAVPISLASSAPLVGTAEHCAELQDRAPAAPVHCIEALPAGVPPGTRSPVDLFRGIEVLAMKNLHSAVTGPDGYHVPVLPFPGTAFLEHPATPEDMLDTLGHLPDAEGGSVLYRFRIAGFTLVWHDTSGPVVESGPTALDALRGLRQVDVQVGAIQGFNQYTNGMRDPRTYIEALRPRIFVPSHHDDWAFGITARGERYRPFLRDELALIGDGVRPRVRFISDPQDYVDPRAVRFRLPRAEPG
jgi:L-ascorbate metabolism protein UlaG (beta-lactamase superfamily)